MSGRELSREVASSSCIVFQYSFKGLRWSPSCCLPEAGLGKTWIAFLCASRPARLSANRLQKKKVSFSDDAAATFLNLSGIFHNNRFRVMRV